MNTFHAQGPVEIDGAQTIQSARYVPVLEPTTEVDKLQRRLNTYTHWNSKKTSLQLATAGFIYTGVTDKVECQSCGIRLYNWQEDEDPMQAHKQYAPDCDFMLKNFPHIKTAAKPKTITKVKHPEYADFQRRLKSFDSWPLKCIAQKPEIMAKCGFFYIGSADRARCHFCGVTLRDWDTDDYPPCAHRQWSENCPFVQGLNVEAIKVEIEDMERMEKFTLETDGSNFIDCSSSKKQPQDGVFGAATSAMSTATFIATATTTGTQVYSQVSDLSTDGFCFNPAIQAVVEMGYAQEVIQKAVEIRKREGISNPNASSLLEAILDMED